MGISTITLQYSNERGNKKNTSYPFRFEIQSVEELKKVAQFDHVCGEYADGKNTRGNIIKGYRSKKSFRKANCLPVDCDNTNPNPLETDIPAEEWKTPKDVQAAFPDVPFYVVYSRNNMKEKDGKAARPRFHVYFIINETASEKYLAKLKKKVQEYFPAFDPAALDAARFLFGVDDPKVEFYEGNTPLNVFMARLNTLPEVIPIGQRNGTLSQYAAKVLKRYGDTEQAEKLFEEAADHCEEPLDDLELNTIWDSAKSFYHRVIEKDANYQNPDEYAWDDFDESGSVTSDTIKHILKKMNIGIRLNLITGKAEINGMPPQHSKTNAANVLPVKIMDKMTEWGMSCSRQTLDDCLVLIEDENRYNPVEEMLKNTKYDGKDRLTELSQILGISENKTYVLYLTKWLHQCVAMALNDENDPYGADGVLVIRGPQGAGKTLFCSKIAMRAEWFAEGVSIDPDKKDSVIQATSVWIAELGELDGTLKRDQPTLKAMMTARSDTYCQPYARVATTKPRHTSFCATVNPMQFLIDETGSRRWWIIEPTKIDCDRLRKLPEKWFQQMWAQVYTKLYLLNPQGFRLTPEEREKLQSDNERYNKPMQGETEILDKLAWDSPASRWRWTTATSVRDDLCLKPLSASQIGKVLMKLAEKDEHIRVKASGGRNVYLLPKEAMSVEDDGPVLSDEVLQASVC